MCGHRAAWSSLWCDLVLVNFVVCISAFVDFYLNFCDRICYHIFCSSVALLLRHIFVWKKNIYAAWSVCTYFKFKQIMLYQYIKRKPLYFGYVVHAKNLGTMVTCGQIDGKRKCGRSTRHWTDDIRDFTQPLLAEFVRASQDRTFRRTMCHWLWPLTLSYEEEFFQSMIFLIVVHFEMLNLQNVISYSDCISH